MFNIFKKKSIDETNELFHTITAKELLMGIEAIKKRNRLNINSATFQNTYISPLVCKKLKLKGVSIERSADDKHSYTISWN